jgi:hypothetical protein
VGSLVHGGMKLVTLNLEEKDNDNNDDDDDDDDDLHLIGEQERP